MRTFHWNAPIIIGAGCLALSFLAPAPTSSLAQEQPAQQSASLDLSPMAGVSLRGPTWADDEPAVTEPATIASVRAQLDKSDRDVAFRALEIALMQLGDGATLVWKRQKNGLSGVIKTISAFRDEKGRICRKVNYSITLGSFERSVDGTACRDEDGQWNLAS